MNTWQHASVWKPRVGHPGNAFSAKSHPPFAKKLSPPDNIEKEITPVPTTISDTVSDTTRTAEWITEFDEAHYRHEDVLPRVKQINDPEIELPDLSNAHVLSFPQSFHAYSIDHARGKRSVTTIAAAICF